MKLDTAPIAVAATALTIPAIAPVEAEKTTDICTHFSELKATLKYCLKVNPVNTSKNIQLK